MFEPEAAPKTREEILTEAFELLYDELSEVGKQALRNAAERKERRTTAVERKDLGILRRSLLRIPFFHLLSRFVQRYRC